MPRIKIKIILNHSYNDHCFYSCIEFKIDAFFNFTITKCSSHNGFIQ